MNTLYQILALVGACFVVWWLYRTIKSRPDQFSKENLGKSFSTMGILGIILMAFVAFLILLVRQST